MAKKNYDIELMGEKLLAARMIEAGKKAVPALASALYTAGNLTMREAKNQVPFDTGVLKSSGRVDEPQITGGNVTVDLGFGGAAAAYALRMHEGKGLHFQSGKKAHYLRDPMKTTASGVLSSLLAKEIGKIL